MKVTEQGARDGRRQRYQTVPRVLIFLTSANPQTGAQEVLLLKGAPTKRLWAGRYNGLGGHVEEPPRPPGSRRDRRCFVER